MTEILRLPSNDAARMRLEFAHFQQKMQSINVEGDTHNVDEQLVALTRLLGEAWNSRPGVAPELPRDQNKRSDSEVATDKRIEATEMPAPADAQNLWRDALAQDLNARQATPGLFMSQPASARPSGGVSRRAFYIRAGAGAFVFAIGVVLAVDNVAKPHKPLKPMATIEFEPTKDLPAPAHVKYSISARELAPRSYPAPAAPEPALQAAPLYRAAFRSSPTAAETVSPTQNPPASVAKAPARAKAEVLNADKPANPTRKSMAPMPTARPQAPAAEDARFADIYKLLTSKAD